MFATGQETIVDDLLDGDLAPLHTGTVALGIRHVLCTPLRLVRYVERADEKTDEEIIGVLYLDSRERGALQSAAARAALETLSAEAALAIENARLYREALDKAKFEQELKVAAAIQQALLPAGEPRGRLLHDRRGVRRAAGRSAATSSTTSDLPTGQFGFILGDVAGKGSPAALLAAAVLGMFSVAATYQTSAATLVTRLNDGLFRRAIEARFLTTFYGILGADGTFTYSNAGHNPPILVTAQRRAPARDGRRWCSGCSSRRPSRRRRCSSQPGDFIVTFSDGVTEALNVAGEEFTDERLLAAVEACRHDAPQQIVDGILARLRQFCGGATQTDDITVVLVRYDGRPA